jgi:hypothetical protein
MFPDRYDAKVMTGRNRQGWWLSIYYGLEFDRWGRKSWNKSHLVEGRFTEKYALDDVLEMFDIAADGNWTLLSNMDSDDEDEGGDDAYYSDDDDGGWANYGRSNRR